MKAFLKHPMRVTGRSLRLAVEILCALIDFVAHVPFQRDSSPRVARAVWLQRTCRRALRIFNVELHATGPLPSSGLLVCNHLSYLDILVLGATGACVFVSKCEVKRWPVFGWFASLAGTVFVHHHKRSGVARAIQGMQGALDGGTLVVLFAEGTTTDGSEVLPFKSALLEPATRSAHALSAGFIQYTVADGDVTEEVCYWKDMTFLPHLVNLLAKRGVRAFVSFTQLREESGDRKQLARRLRCEVLRLKEALCGSTFL